MMMMMMMVVVVVVVVVVVRVMLLLMMMVMIITMMNGDNDGSIAYDEYGDVGSHDYDCKLVVEVVRRIVVTGLGLSSQGAQLNLASYM